MLSQFAWPVRYLVMLSMGTALCLTMLALARPRVLRIIGALPYLSPNWLTIWRVPIVGAGTIIYLSADGRENWLIAGLLITVMGMTLDRIDGKMAKSLRLRLRFLPGLTFRHHKEISSIHSQEVKQPPLTKSGLLWAWYTQEKINEQGNVQSVDCCVYIDDWIPGLTGSYTRIPMFKLERDISTIPHSLRLSLTGIGEWLDPLIDKVNFFPLFIFMAVNHLVSVPLTVAVITIDLLSTVLRKPFDQVAPFKYWQRFVREAKASAFGKTKVIWQFLTLLSLMPVTAGWLNSEEAHTSWWISNTLLTIGALSGILSVVSRLTLMDYLLVLPGLRRFNKSLKEVYEHDVSEED